MSPTPQMRTTRAEIKDILGRRPRWHDVDDRAAEAPMSSVCQVWLEAGGNFPSSGWFARTDTVVTAGHAANGDRITDGAWKLWVRPAAGDDWFAATAVLYPTQWRHEGFAAGAEHDLAVIRLEGAVAGVLPSDLGGPASATEGSDVQVFGYPRGTHRLQRSRGRIVEAGSAHLFHDCDTNPGHSGAPLIKDGRVIGVHVAGVREGPGNTALALNGSRRSWLVGQL